MEFLHITEISPRNCVYKATARCGGYSDSRIWCTIVWVEQYAYGSNPLGVVNLDLTFRIRIVKYCNVYDSLNVYTKAQKTHRFVLIWSICMSFRFPSQ